MSVHYKFKAALEFSTITFDGIHISVADLKSAIIDQKKLAKNADSDLQITNAQTEEIYDDEAILIPKNTSVIVARVPSTDRKKSSNYAGGGFGGGPPHLRHQNRPLPPIIQPSAIAKGVDLTAMEGTEEDKIHAMMDQSTHDYDPTTYARIRGGNQFGRVPPQYRCFKCNLPGHWIRDCTVAGAPQLEEVKKSTGIPRSFMVAVDGPEVPGALITPEGRYAVPAVDHAAYLDKNKPVAEPPVPKPKIPEELLCNLCQDLLTDALMIPCCANSYCDDCIRSALLESEDQECPSCHEKEISPTSLIPNRFLRSTVNNFKNETGYSKPQKVVEVVRTIPPTVDLTLPTPTEPTPRKLSLDELPDDLFPHSPRKMDTLDPFDKSDKGKDATDSEQDDKTDLYDFNDASIPSPFNSATGIPQGKTIMDSNAPKEQSISTIDHGNTFHERGSFHLTRKTPLHSELPPIPTGLHHRGEPPPPGFEEFPPGHDHGSPRRDDRGQGQRIRHDERQDHNRPHTRSLLSMPLPGNVIPFNPNQPPPGFPGMPPGMGPPMFGGNPGMGPGPGPMHTNAPYGFQQNFRGPPPGNFGGPPQMYGGPRHPSDRYPRERMRPYAREHPMDRENRERDRDRERDREKENRIREHRGDVKPHEGPPGIIDDPLLEFERLMREKDRRKQQAELDKAQPAPAPKRSRSRSFSPTRRTPSPFLKRPRSPYSRSPSPKRKRLVRRRNSYSRSKSRSPGGPRRIAGRSRSRNRTPSLPPVAPPPMPQKRRSPRRAPPYSPSPPPTRLPPRIMDKEEYFDKHPPARFEASRHGSSGSRSFPREFEGPHKYEGSSSKYEGVPKFDGPPKYDVGPIPKFDGPSKYDGGSKYLESGLKYDGSSKYESGHKYEGGSKYESGGSKYESSSSKYDGGSKYDSGAQGPKYEGGPSKYEGGPKYEGKSGSKYESDGRSKYESSSKYDSSSRHESGSKYDSSTTKYESTAQYDRKYDTKYDKYEGNSSSKYESSKYDTSAANKYESAAAKHDRERERQSSKKYERSSASRGYQPHGSEQSRLVEGTRHSSHSHSRDRERDRDSRLAPHDPNLLPPGTEQPPPFSQSQSLPPVSLFDLKISKPHGLAPHDEKTSYYNPGMSPSHAVVPPHITAPTVDRDRERELDSVSVSLSPESEARGHVHRHRKSGEVKENSPSKSEKRVKKEKRKHKKKSRDEKEKDKKSKKKKTKTSTSKNGEPTHETESESGTSRRNSGETPLTEAAVTNATVPTVIVAQADTGLNIPVICDSTVKSPEHGNIGKTTANDQEEWGNGSAGMETNLGSLDMKSSNFMENMDTKVPVGNPFLTERIEDIFSLEATLDKPLVKAEKEDQFQLEQAEPAVPIPPSKWDMYDDENQEDERMEEKAVVPSPDLKQAENLKIDERMVTTEVIKRAENALFHKAVSSIRPSEVKKPSPKINTHSDVKSPELQKEPEVKREARRTNNSSIQITVATSVAEPSAEKAGSSIKRSVRDRLGSKVPEEQVRDRDRDRGRDRDRDRERDRGDSKSKETSTVKSQVSVSRSDKDRDRDRERERERRHRSRSKSAIRLSALREEPPRMIIQLRPRSRNRSPMSSRSRDNRNRRRSRSRSPRPRSRVSPVRSNPRRRTRSPVRIQRRRSPSVERRRAESRNYRDQDRDRDQRRVHRNSSPVKTREESKMHETNPPAEEDKEPSPPGVSPKTLSKAEEEENWKICQDKFVPIGFAPVVVERSYTPPPTGQKLDDSIESKKVSSKSAPVPLALRKQKGRINIKLSSTSKADEDDSSSSTSDEDGKSSTKVRSSIESETEKRKRHEKREKKKAKRRKSNSTTSSSSDSEERRKRRAKKKKKKKSKKKKK